MMKNKFETNKNINKTNVFHWAFSIRKELIFAVTFFSISVLLIRRKYCDNTTLLDRFFLYEP